jgi:autotransporter-associated beta strand protein
MLAVSTWDGGGTDNNWTTAANWVGDVAPTAGDDLVFDGTVRTSTQNNFSVGTSFSSVTFASDDFSLAGNRITLTSGITVDSGLTASVMSLNVTLGGSITVDVVDTSLSISGVLSGSNSLTKSGDGTLIVSGSNTYTGATTVSDGVLQVNDGGVLGTGSITNNASLVFNRSTNTTLSSAVSGTGDLIQQGTGTLTLTATNSYSGGTTISAV